MSKPQRISVASSLLDLTCPFRRTSQSKLAYLPTASDCGPSCAFPLPQTAGHESYLEVPCAQWALRLSFNAFAELMLLLEEKRLPCIVSVVHAGFEHWHGGSPLKIKRGEGRLEIGGGSFTLSLKESHIGAIAVVGETNDQEAGPALTLYNRAGELVARVQSLPEADINARWREIMCCHPRSFVAPSMGRISD